MSVELQPKILELTQRGATAALLLDAQRQFSAELVEAVLKRIDEAVTNDRVTPERALQWVAEIAAYRRIVQRQQQLVHQGRAAQHRLEESNG